MPRRFSPPRWLASAHLQTLAAALPLWAPPRWSPVRASEAVRIPLPGGGQVHGLATWAPAAGPLAIILHGLGGHSGSRYAVRAAVALHRAGLHVLRLDGRGAGGSLADAPTLGHAGLVADPLAAIAYAAADPRVSGIAVVGFSIGGHVALRLAGELGAAAPSALRAIVSISAPADLALAVRAIERPAAAIYHRYILRGLRAQAAAFARTHPARAAYAPAEAERLRSIRAFDERIVAPMHGFADAADYYARASAAPVLGRIAVPTLIVHADDDPIVPPDVARAGLAGAAPAVRVATTARGGHVGWFAGLGEAAWLDTWALQEALAFLRALGLGR